MKTIRKLYFLTLGLAFSWGATSGVASAEDIQKVSSEVCKECHKEIYKQWAGSMHAQSTALKDPIHGTFYKNVIGSPTDEDVKTKDGKYPVCLQCHAPNAALDKKTKLDSDVAYSEGVNCVSCHTLKSFKGTRGENGKLRLGMMAYETGDTLQGPQGFNRGLTELTAGNDMFGAGGAEAADSKPNPHIGGPVELDGKEIPSMPMEGNAGLMKSNDACMGCHDQRNNAHGVPLCVTGNEYAESRSDVTCQYCHMPMVGEEADHSMGGGHHAGMLKRSILLTMDAKAEGDGVKASVTLKNQQPHNLPTGAPFRNIYVKVAAYDAAGNMVWENAEGNPAKADPQAYLAYLLKDEKGEYTGPPTATQLGEDTRLKPHEKRTLEYTIAAKDVALVRAEVYYNLLWDSLAKKFTQLPEEVRTPQQISVAEVRL